MPGKGQAGYIGWARRALIVSALSAMLLALLYVAMAIEAYECQHEPNTDVCPQISYWGSLLPASLLAGALAALFWRLAWPLVVAWAAIGALYMGVSLYLLLPSVQEANGLHYSAASVAWHMLRDPWVLGWVVAFLLALPALWEKPAQFARMHDGSRQGT